MNGRTNSSDVTIEEINHGALIPLEAPTNLQLAPLDKKATIRWEDPVDKYADPGGELASQWAYSIVVRKESSAPTSPEDGVLVLKTTTRNQYSSDVYTDDGNLDNTKLYYYAVYAYNTYDVPSEPVVSSVQPRDAILEFNQTLSDGLRGEYYSYGSNLSTTSDGRGFVGAASLNNRAIFAGGQLGQNMGSSHTNRYPCGSVVDIYDESLTRSNGPNLRAQMGGPNSVANDNYAFFAGGWRGNGSSHQANTSATAYDTSFTTHGVSIPSLSNLNDINNKITTLRASQRSAAGFDSIAIFPRCQEGGNWSVVDQSLTVSSIPSPDASVVGEFHYITSGRGYADGAIFVSGAGSGSLFMVSINKSLTSQLHVFDSYPSYTGFYGNEAGILNAGDYLVGNVRYNNTPRWFAIDRWFTLQNRGSSTREFTSGASIGTYAVFAGDIAGTSAGGEGYDRSYTTVKSINHSLTVKTETVLSEARSWMGAATAGDNLLFAGGWVESYSYGVNYREQSTVDVYTIR